MHVHGVDAFGDGNRVRMGDELAAVDHVGDPVDREDQVLSAIPDRGGDRVGTGIGGSDVTAVVEVEEAKGRGVDQRGRNLLTEGRHQA